MSEDTPVYVTAPQMMSADIGELAASLAKAQGQMKVAAKDSKNPHLNSRYADIASVFDACRAALSANCLAVSQFPFLSEDGRLTVTTLLLHSSGQWLRNELSIILSESKGLTPVQTMGSAITYLRRYGLSAVAGIVADDDDDGASAGRQGETPARQPIERRTVPGPMPVKCADCDALVDGKFIPRFRELGEVVRCPDCRTKWRKTKETANALAQEPLSRPAECSNCGAMVGSEAAADYADKAEDPLCPTCWEQLEAKMGAGEPTGDTR